MAPLQIAPSILAADFANLGDAVALVAQSADTLHVDVMDGHFVPNLSIGPPVVKSLRKATDLHLDCHLMMTNPGDYLEAFKKAGADACTIHVEIGNTAALIAQMRDLGLGVGLALNPDLGFDAVAEFIGDIDLLLCMSVFPGFGGQSFIADVLQTVTAARAEIDQARPLHRCPDRWWNRPANDRLGRRRRRDKLRGRHRSFRSDRPCVGSERLT